MFNFDFSVHDFLGGPPYLQYMTDRQQSWMPLR